ncbi:hypothetical protein K1719_023034 [Acacia pycnantha]|nr:hypothetical protein K1719_023034 [Acacia pycnantha]
MFFKMMMKLMVLKSGTLLPIALFVSLLHLALSLSILGMLLMYGAMEAPRDRNVEAGKEFVDSDHPPLFTPFKFESYADIRKTTNLIAGEALEYFLRSHPAENTSEDPKVQV